jgi:LysM repeat protein
MVAGIYAWWIVDPILVADAAPELDYRPNTYQVTSGDTLWGVARTYYPERDPRQVVWEIQQLNDMDSPTIYPYEVLKLPK